MVASAQSTIFPFIHTLPVPLNDMTNSWLLRPQDLGRKGLRPEAPVRVWFDSTEFPRKTGRACPARGAVSGSSSRNGCRKAAVRRRPAGTRAGGGVARTIPLIRGRLPGDRRSPAAPRAGRAATGVPVAGRYVCRQGAHDHVVDHFGSRGFSAVGMRPGLRALSRSCRRRRRLVRQNPVSI
jgi:hypothetical protein